MTEDELLDLAHSCLRYNAPLADWRVRDLIGRAVPVGECELLDIGCGDGRLLLESLAARPECHGHGIDLNRRAIERARAAAEQRGLGERAGFHVSDVADWVQRADTVFCVGASHAWPDRAAAFGDLLTRTHRHGRLVFGDGFWQRQPTPAALDVLGSLPSFSELVATAVEAGWRPLHVAEATLDEHDTWESDWRAGLELSGNRQARALADERRIEYFDVYRGLLGFAWMVLTPA